jgi:hypothetical protein
MELSIRGLLAANSGHILLFMPDIPPLAPDKPRDLTAQIASELIIAWERLGGRPDTLPHLEPGHAV